VYGASLAASYVLPRGIAPVAAAPKPVPKPRQEPSAAPISGGSVYVVTGWSDGTRKDQFYEFAKKNAGSGQDHVFGQYDDPDLVSFDTNKIHNIVLVDEDVAVRFLVSREFNSRVAMGRFRLFSVEVTNHNFEKPLTYSALYNSNIVGKDEAHGLVLVEHIPYTKETETKTIVVGVILTDYAIADVMRDRALLYMADHMRDVENMFETRSFRINPVLLPRDTDESTRAAAVRQLQDYMKGPGGAVILVHTSLADEKNIPELARLLHSAVGNVLLGTGEGGGSIRLGITPGPTFLKARETKLSSELKQYGIEVKNKPLLTLRYGSSGVAVDKKEPVAADQYVIVRSASQRDGKDESVDKMVAVFADYLRGGAIKNTITVDDWSPNKKDLYNGIKGLVFAIGSDEDAMTTHKKIKEMDNAYKSVELHMLVGLGPVVNIIVQPHGLFNASRTHIGQVDSSSGSRDVDLMTFTRRTGTVHAIAFIKNDANRHPDPGGAHLRYQLELESTVGKLDEYLSDSNTRISVNAYDTIDELETQMGKGGYEQEIMLVISITNRVTGVGSSAHKITDPEKESAIVTRWAILAAISTNKPVLVMMVSFHREPGSLVVSEHPNRVEVQFNKIVDVSSLVPTLTHAVLAGQGAILNTMLFEAEIEAFLSAPADFKDAVTETDGSDRSSGTGSLSKMGSIEECGRFFTEKVRGLISNIVESDVKAQIQNEDPSDALAKLVCYSLQNNNKRNVPFTRDRIEKIAETYVDRRVARARAKRELLEKTRIQKAYYTTLVELINREKNKTIKTRMYRTLLEQKRMRVSATTEDLSRASSVVLAMREAAEKQVSEDTEQARRRAFERFRKQARSHKELQAKGKANKGPDEIRKLVAKLFSDLASSLSPDDKRDMETAHTDMVTTAMDLFSADGLYVFSDEIKGDLAEYFKGTLQEKKELREEQQRMLKQELLATLEQQKIVQNELMLLRRNIGAVKASNLKKDGLIERLKQQKTEGDKSRAEAQRAADEEAQRAAAAQRAAEAEAAKRVAEAEEAERAAGSAKAQAKPKAYVLVKSTNGPLDKGGKTLDEIIAQYKLMDGATDAPNRIIPDGYEVSIVGKYDDIAKIDDPSAIIVIIDKGEGTKLGNKDAFLPFCEYIYTADNMGGPRLVANKYKKVGEINTKTTKNQSIKYTKYKFVQINAIWVTAEGCNDKVGTKRRELTEAILREVLNENRTIGIPQKSDDPRALGYLVAYCDTPSKKLFQVINKNSGPRRLIVLSKFDQSKADPAQRMDQELDTIFPMYVYEGTKKVTQVKGLPAGEVVCDVFIREEPKRPSSFGAATRGRVASAVMRRFV
jgi:hypothetical protein